MGRTRTWRFYLWEDGGTRGFRSSIALFPEEDIGIVLLSNETDEEAGGQLYDMVNSIVEGVLKLRRS
jgi:CubicO group peptidase (beta-lactamase class C family)